MPNLHDVSVEVEVAEEVTSRLAGAEEVGRSDTTEERSLTPYAEDALELLHTCEQALAASPEPRRAAQLHYEMGRLNELHLRNSRKAALHYGQALALAPESIPLLSAARRVFLEHKNYDAALPLFDIEVRITADTRRKATLCLAKGRLLEDVLGRVDEARQAYLVALELDRGDPSILNAVEQCAALRGPPKDLDQTYERIANAVASDSRHRAAVLVRKAKLIESRQGDVEAAIELYEVALRLHPGEHSALESLKRLHHAQRRWRDLIRVLDIEAQNSSDADVRVMAMYRIGRLYTERLGGQQEAIIALERAARESPKDPLLLEELARLYEATEQYDALAATLQNLVDTIREPDQRLSLLHRIGQLMEDKLEQPEQAIHWYELALQHRPTYTPALQSLGKLYTAREDWPSLVRMHQRDAEHADENQRRAASCSRVGEILEVRLGRVPEAIDSYCRALSAVPSYAPAFKALSRLYSQLHQWRELVELYEREVDAAQNAQKAPERVVAFLFKAASIYEDSLQDFVHASHTYKRILELEAGNLGAIQGWQRAAERAGRFQELVDALQLEAEKTNDPTRTVALLQRAGEVLEDKLNDRNGALARFRQVLQIDPQYVPALTSLGRLYYRAGRWEDLLEMYRRELELTTSGPTSVVLLEKMAELCEERVGRDDEAIAHYRCAVDIDPTYQPTLRALGRRLRERQRWPELVEVLEREFACVENAQDRARCSYRLGEVYEERLGEPDKALQAYKQAVNLMPNYRPATDALARLLAERQEWKTLVDDLQREAETTPDAALAISALMRQGELWTGELHEHERAVDCYQRVLILQPDHLGALLALESLFRRLGNWQGLASVCRQQTTVFRDTGARVAAWRELVRLHRWHGIGTAADLRQTYEEILELAPDDIEALEALEKMAFDADDRDSLVRLSGMLAGQATEPAELAAHRLRLAENLEARDDHRALEVYRSALHCAPESMAATRGFSRMAERADDPEALAEAARREAQVAGDNKAAARLLVRSAGVRLERIGDREGARSDLERALELCPDHRDAATHLSALLRVGKEETRLVELLGRAAAAASEPDRMAALWMEVADLQANALSNVGSAISALNRVLRAMPQHAESLRRLAEFYERDGQWNEAIQMLQQLLQSASDVKLLQEARLRLAILWDERLGDVDRARQSLQGILDVDPGDNQALERLSDLQEREGALRDAMATTELLIRAANDSKTRAVALVRLGRIARRLGDVDAAGEALWKAVAIEGPGGQASLECKNVLSAAPQWERYVGALLSYLREHAVSRVQKIECYLEIARCQYDRLRSVDAAIRTLESGLEATDNDATVRAELALRLRMAGKHPLSVAHLQQLIEEDPSRAGVWRDLAQTYREMKRLEEARIATEPLLVLQQAQPNEITAVVQRTRRGAELRAGSLSAEALAELGVLSPTEMVAVDFLRVLEPSLAKLYPADLEAYGVSSRDKIGPKSATSLRRYADRVAAIFGVPDFDLYIHRLRNRGVAVEFGDPVSILVPAAVEELSEAQVTFLLARPMVNISQKMQAFDKLMPRELEVALAAAARQLEPEFGVGLTSEDFLGDWSKRIYRALPWRSRKSFDMAAEAYITAPKINFASLARRVAQTSVFVAATVADDLVSSIEAVRQRDSDSSRQEGTENTVTGSDTASGLLRFWGSARAMRLRQITGLLS